MSDRSDRSVGCTTTIEDSSSIRTVNSEGGPFRCYYCSESFYSDLSASHTERKSTLQIKLSYLQPGFMVNEKPPIKWK